MLFNDKSTYLLKQMVKLLYLILAWWESKASDEMYLILTNTTDCNNILAKVRTAYDMVILPAKPTNMHVAILHNAIFGSCYILLDKKNFHKHAIFSSLIKCLCRLDEAASWATRFGLQVRVCRPWFKLFAIYFQ